MAEEKSGSEERGMEEEEEEMEGVLGRERGRRDRR